MHHLFWNKYLPVIRILLKKAVNEEQNLQLNVVDFEKAGLGRKAGYKFALKIKQGRVDNVVVNSPLASALASLLLHDESTRPLFDDREYHLSLNTKSVLSIRNVPLMEDAHHEQD